MAAPCSTDLDCQLNGICDGSTCRCDFGWRGASCGELALGESAVAVRYEPEPSAGGGWSWGGSPIRDDAGRWHLFFSFLTNACGLLHYQTNSIVRHAVADNVVGPWTIDKEPALGPRAGAWDSGGVHGPNVVREPSSGLYVLFYEATSTDAPPLDCRLNASVPTVDLSQTRRIGAASSASPYGPWERLHEPLLAPRSPSAWDAGDVSNAAPLILANGTTFLGYRAGGDGVKLGGGIGMAIASSWRGPFARAGTSRDAMLFAAEDAVLWRDERRGAFHMLVHRFAGANGSTAGTEVGGHAWSVDALTWHYDYASVAYNSTVRWRNGSAGSVLYRRERPKPVVDAATGRVTYLLNGGWPCHEGAEDDDSLDGLAGCWSYTVGTEVVE